jgi:metallo-beta-lactamase family protein
VLDVEEGRRTRRIVFTGDLGRYDRPILRDPEVAEGAHVLITESTYGDRNHDGTERMEEDLAQVVRRTHERGGKLLIPSFALERAQEVIFALKKLLEAERIPRVRVYVDSPLTVQITEIFKLHPECYDAETRALMRAHDSPFDFPDLRYVDDVEGSKAIDADREPSIIISASGMCEAGRILHHLKAGIEDPKNTVLIVGYQAQHTLGRRLVEQRARVRIFGVERERRAEVVVLNGFSAHADQKDLVGYATATAARGAIEHIALVHGDPKPQEILGGLLAQRGLGKAFAPAPGERLDLGGA